jgi:heat shock protein HslJ
MKKILFACFLITVFLISCKSQTVVEKTPLDLSDIGKEMKTDEIASSEFSNVMGKDWKLIEVRINNVDTGFNRSSLTRSGTSEFFTASFDSEMISGTGSPNRYSAPYKLGEGRDISLMTVRATLMAAIFESEKLKEHNFFGYIQSAYRWNLVNNNLVLSSKAENGSEVVLVFSL